MKSRASHLNVNNWVPKVLFIGNDLSFEKKIGESFEKEVEYFSVRSSTVALKLIDQNVYDVILYDEELANNETFEGRGTIPLSEIYQTSIKRLPKVTFIVFYAKKSTYIKNFEKKNHTTLLYERDKASPSRISFALHFLKRKYFRSIFLKDLRPKQVFEFDLYHYNFQSKNYEILFKEGTSLPDNFKTLTSAKHFYVQTSIFHSLEGGAISKLEITKHFDAIRKLYKYLFANLIDDCGVGDLKMGQEMRDIAQKIIKYLIIVISKYQNEYEALDEMPYSVSSILGHGINTAIYSLIFSKLLWGSFNEEMAVAGLLHELGLSTFDFHLLKRDETSISPTEKITLEQHVKETIVILRTKMFKSSATIDSCIESHHETVDGMGYPRGLEEKSFTNEMKLFSICFYFDRVRCLGSRDSLKTVDDTLAYLKNMPRTLKDAPKFDLRLIEQISIRLSPLKKSTLQAA